VAEFNPLQRFALADLVRRMLGEDLVLGSTSPELGLSLTLESDRPEWQVLQNTVPWNHVQTIAALAGNFSLLLLAQTQPTVPAAIAPTQGVRLTVVKKVIVCNNTAAAQKYKLGMIQTLSVLAGTKGASRDLRSLSVTTQVVTIQQAGDQLPSVQAFSVPANDHRTIDVDWMVQQAGLGAAGASVLVLQGGVVNQEVTAYFFGYERQLRPEETSF
jgi:hypothetical protein